MDKWMGKVAVVTGASSGIGAAVAKELASHGMIVVGLARRSYLVEEMARQIDGEIVAKHCDMTNEKDVRESFAWVGTKYGSIDILVNCAGVCKPASLIDGKTKDWETMLDVNVLALSIATREALRIMRFVDKGHIIHISSLIGHLVPDFKNVPLGMYAATKHGVKALTEALRLELLEKQSNIKISSISPGTVWTPMHKDLDNYEGGEEEDDEEDADSLVDDVYNVEQNPKGYLNVKDVVAAVLYALKTPPNVQVHDVLIQAVGMKYHSQ